MIPIAPLTAELLDELSQELGGCDFSGENERLFLSRADSCDVQAVPGNGKTTLLVAKLALLSRTWTSRTQGICVISHTNAAREEIEKKLHAHPAASAFLGYPHFIGTVTSFLDRFVALPYLRGLGWPMQRVDDDVFAAVALSRWQGKTTLAKSSRVQNGRNRFAIENWVMNLELALDFDDGSVSLPQRLKVKKKHDRQPGPASDSGRELEELKAELVCDGFYRYGDMTELAVRAIAKCPTIVARLRKRFPLVILDEAQDTNGTQLKLLDQIFGEGTAYQRLGDQNQTLYEQDDLTPEGYWKARDGVIPLDETRRFGSAIASFASRLTVRAPQQIQGSAARPSRRTLILFDQESILNVMSAYAVEIREHWKERRDLDVWAVASRHNPARRGQWPATLPEYCPEYRSGREAKSQPDNFCVPLRQAAILHEAHAAPAQVVDLFVGGLTVFLRHQGFRDELGQLVSKRSLWSFLASKEPNLPLKIRRLIRDHIVYGRAPWKAGSWQAFCHELKALLGLEDAIEPKAAAFIDFVDAGAVPDDEQIRQQSRTVYTANGVRINLGSIHSVKGKTVDAILVLETEVWRGQAASDRAMDLATVLPHAFGLEDRDFSASAAQLAAATNVFVALTRPRELLACAMRKEASSDALIAAACEQDWYIRDLTVGDETGGVGNGIDCNKRAVTEA